MVIDFHTHTYPPKLASVIKAQLSAPKGLLSFTDGTAAGLEDACIKNDVEKCVVLPIVSNPVRTNKDNRHAAELNEKGGRLISFGGIHPDNEDYREILTGLANEGFIGIKLHPVFQRVDFDDIRYKRIVDCACEKGLLVSVHAGLDVNDPDAYYASVPHVRNLLMDVKPERIVLAHMGGHLSWDEAEDMLTEYLAVAPSGSSVYLDTAFCLPSPVASQNIVRNFLSNEQFVRITRLVGADHVLFGTDSPWTDQGPAMDAIKNSGLTEKEISRILYENAKDLLDK